MLKPPILGKTGLPAGLKTLSEQLTINAASMAFPRFHSNSDESSLLFQVADRDGIPVTGLTKRNFEIFSVAKGVSGISRLNIDLRFPENYNPNQPTPGLPDLAGVYQLTYVMPENSFTLEERFVVFPLILLVSQTDFKPGIIVQRVGRTIINGVISFL